MNLLKKWLVENGYLAADAKDDEVEPAAEKAMSEKKLTLAKYRELSADVSAQRAEFAKSISDPILTAVKEQGAALSGLSNSIQSLVTVLTPKQAKGGDPTETADEDTDEPEEYKVDDRVFSAVEKHLADKGYKPAGDDNHAAKGVLKLAATFHDEKDPETVRVKRAAERFADNRTQRKHTKGIWAGQPMSYQGEDIDEATPRDNALYHAWFKMQVCPESLSEHDKDLCAYIVETKRFVNTDANSAAPRKLTPEEVAEWKYRINRGIKAPLLDDTATSGGAYSVPEFFDRNSIVVPLLDMEISPWVNVVDVPRGSAAQNFVFGTFTVTKTAEGSAASAFDATSLIANKDTTFFPAQCILEVGRDYLSDAVPHIGSLIMGQMNRAFGAWADEQIISGDGTTEPQGILNASGTVAVPSTNSVGGPLEIADLVNLRFGVGKAHYRNYDRSRANYAMTETAYARFRGKSTGVTNDDRLLFGDNLDSYELLGHKVGNPNYGMGNSNIVFCQFGGYRWYRRQGVQFVTETGGSTLLYSNLAAIVGRTRNGGQLDRGAYAAVMTDAQA